jgi:hypothetical protein
MKPLKLGRILGTGLRVAGRIAGQRINAGARSAEASSAASASAAEAGAGAQVQAAKRAAASRNLAGGLGGVLRPFRRVGGIVWLEVTGAFFLLFVPVFAQALWSTRNSYAHGPAHQKFLVSAAMTAVFLYLGLTSFWRARRR